MAPGLCKRGKKAGGRRSVGLAGVFAGLALASGGCSPKMDPATYVTGLRVLLISAQPPEVAPGQTATVSALAIDTQGRPLSADWSVCLEAPQQGQAVNPDCLTGTAGPQQQPLGSGLQVTVTMPTPSSAKSLGLPDASGGLYLPLVAQVAAGLDSLVATYGLRVNLTGEPANQNPTLSGVYTVVPGPGSAADAGDAGAGDVVTAIDPATPLPVHSGDVLTLRASFAAGSVETYQILPTSSAGGTAARTVTETLTVAFLATAGTVSGGTSGVDRPDRILTLDPAHLPAPGTTIDLWAIGRDERGGASFLHRTLLLQ